MRTQEEHIKNLQALREQCAGEKEFLANVAQMLMLRDEQIRNYNDLTNEIAQEAREEARVLFSFRQPKMPMTRPYSWVLLDKRTKDDQYNVCRKFHDERGGFGTGSYSNSYAEALDTLKESIENDLNYWALRELGKEMEGAK